MELFDHLRRLIHGLREAEVPHALCGGLALAVHDVPRATLDIDLLIQEEDLEQVKQVASGVGFRLDTGWIPTRHPEVRIYRLACPDDELDDVVPLDLILVSPALQEAWDTREEVEWRHGRLCVVSRRGLVVMKSLRLSDQDRHDLRRLEGD